MNSLLLLASLVFQAASVPPDRSSEIPARYQGRIVAGPPAGFKKKFVALTFDDGPEKTNTTRILSILKKEKIKATFFVLGASAKLHPELLQTIVADGHQLGHHTWTHPSKTTPQSAIAEMAQLSALVKKWTGKSLTMFRPPYGIVKGNMVPIAKRQKMVVTLWDIDTLDWKAKSATPVLNKALKAHPGSIVLMHDGYGQKHASIALPGIISGLKNRGFSFVTVPELLTEWDKFVVESEAAKAKKKADAVAKKAKAAKAKNPK